MAYRFKLETLLRLKERYLELMEAELARVLAKLAEAKKAYGDKLAELNRADKKLEEILEAGVTATRYKQIFRFREHLRGELLQMYQRVQALEKQVQATRVKVAERHREKELVERLKQRDYAAYVAEEQRRAQVEADDLSGLRFGRQHETNIP